MVFVVGYFVLVVDWFCVVVVRVFFYFDGVWVVVEFDLEGYFFGFEIEGVVSCVWGDEEVIYGF